MSKHSISRTWPHTINVESAPITCVFKRMKVDEFIEWERKYLSYRTPPAGADVDEDSPVVLEHGLETLKWIRASLDALVSIPEGELDIDGAELRTGGQLFDEFGSNMPLMMQFINCIWTFHRFDGAARKNFLSLSALLTTSVEPPTEAAGPRPEPTAGHAANGGSATNEDAGQPDAPTAELSGAMA